MKGNNQYINCLIAAAAIIVVSLVMCKVITGGFLFDDNTEMYNCVVLILKGIMASGAIIAISVYSAIMLKK